MKGVGTKYRVILEEVGPSGGQEEMHDGYMKKRHIDGWIRFRWIAIGKLPFRSRGTY